MDEQLVLEYDEFRKWCAIRFMTPLPFLNYLLERGDYHMDQYMASKELNRSN